MQDQKLEKLKKVLELLKEDTITPKDLERIVSVLVETVRKSHAENQEMSQDIKGALKQVVEYVDSKTVEAYRDLTSETDKRVSLTEKQAKEALKTAQEAIREIKELYVPDDIDEEKIIAETLKRVPKVEIEEETGDSIVSKINELPENGEKIDASHIKNLPTSQRGGFGGMVVREIVAGTGITIDNSKPGYPKISSTGGEGSGDMVKSVYDPNGKNVDAFDYNNLENTPTIPAAQIQSDWNQTNNTALDYIKNKPTIPSAYILPTASGSVKGGVKIGARLTMDENGVLSADIQGGTGAVDSVNGKTGTVVLGYSDVGAAPALSADDNYVTDAEKTSIGTIGNKVDKVTGKGLSTNDYTTEEQTKLSGIEAGAEVNNISDINATDLTDGGATTLHKHSYGDLDNKPTLGTAAAQDVGAFATSGHNHSGVYEPAKGTDDNYVTDTEKSNLHAPHSDDQDLSGKVDVVAGKGLSTNDYDDAAESKLAGIEVGANNYTHPATHSADVIVDGTTNKAYTATEKTKLAGIEAGAEVNNISDINATDLTDGGATTLHKHSYNNLDDKPTIPTVPSMASVSDINTGTDTTKTINADALAGSNLGIRYVQMILFDFATDIATGDGKGYFVVPAGLNGMNLISVHAKVVTAGTTNTTDIQINNVTDNVDILSTKITIDSGETGSDTAATAAVIDATKDDVATNDVLRIDVDAASTTKPKGLIVTLGFQLA
ncbi:MAG: hypothetical protein WCQ96_03130 [Patescibacteria group bacterium]